MQWITALDFQILHEIQNRFSCSFLDFWMPKITALGNGGILWILLAVNQKKRDTAGCRQYGMRSDRKSSAEKSGGT